MANLYILARSIFTCRSNLQVFLYPLYTQEDKNHQSFHCTSISLGFGDETRKTEHWFSLLAALSLQAGHSTTPLPKHAFCLRFIHKEINLTSFGSLTHSNVLSGLEMMILLHRFQKLHQFLVSVTHTWIIFAILPMFDFLIWISSLAYMINKLFY